MDGQQSIIGPIAILGDALKTLEAFPMWLQENMILILYVIFNVTYF